MKVCENKVYWHPATWTTAEFCDNPDLTRPQLKACPAKYSTYAQ